MATTAGDDARSSRPTVDPPGVAGRLLARPVESAATLGLGLAAIALLADAVVALWAPRFAVTGSLFAAALGVGIILVCYLALRREAAERQALTRDLAESERRLRLAFRGAKAGAWELDPATGRAVWSEELYDLLGVDRSVEPTLESFRGMIHPDDRDRASRELEALLAAGDALSLEFRVVRPDGSEIWLTSHGRVERVGGRPVRVTGINQDVTARKQAEREIRESESRFRLLADAMPQIVYVSRPDGVPEYLNRRWREYTGASEREAFDLARYVHPDDLETMVRRWREAKATGGVFESELRLRGADGAYRWFLTRSVAENDASGSVARWFGTSTDIDDAKQAEAGLRANERRLRFLNEASDATRPLSDPGRIMAEMARLLGTHLAASRCAYAEVDRDGDRFAIRHDYVDGVPSTVGDYSLDLFGPRAAADMRSGRTLVVRDVDRELAPADGADMFNAIGIKAIVCCPLVKGGRLTAMMAVHQTGPRDWKPDEISLVEAAVERSWAYLERARADRRLRESEERLRLAVAIARMGTFEIDLLTDEVRVNDPGREIYGWAEGEPLTFAKVQGHFHPDDRDEVMRRVDAAFDPDGPGVFEVEQRIFRTDGALRWIRVRGLGQFAGDGGGRRAVRCVGTYLDVTERRTAEQALRESEERLRLAQRAGRVGVWHADIEGGSPRTWWSETTWELYGRDPAAAPAPEEVFRASLHPDDRGRVLRAIEELLASARNDFREEFRIVRPDGSVRWVESVAQVTRDEAGGPARIAGVNIDLTDRKRAEERLRAAEERFEFVRRSSGVGFWYCDLPFDVLEWDEQVKAHFHLPPDARITIDTFYDRIHPDDREPTRKAIERSIAGRTPYDVDYRTVDPATGAERWVRAIGRTFYAPDGSPRRFDGVTLDVTAGKLGEEALTRSAAAEKRRSALLGGVAAASREINASLSVDEIARIITEQARSVVGAHQAVTSLTVGDGWDQAINAVSLSDEYAPWRDYDAAPKGDGIYALVCRTNRPLRLTQDELVRHPAWQGFGDQEGRHPPMRGWLAVPLVGKGGRNLGLIQLSDKYEGDFTEEDESVLAQLAAVAAVGIENARLYESLREADRRKDQFLATLAHELRNPLAPISNALEAWPFVKKDPAELDRLRETMTRQVGQMKRLIDDLLDVSRITRGKIALRRERTDLKGVLDAAVEGVKPLIEARRHRLAVSIPDPPPVVDGDVARLLQVFSNLIHNAAKYTGEGGDIRVSVRIDPRRNAAVVDVTDDGPGIPSEMLAHIFDMFVQVDQTLDRAHGGLGIGLTLVKTLVDLHGGTVEARSEGPGTGSTFTVALPLAPPEETAKGSAEPTAGSLPKFRILVVDDVRPSARTLALMLKGLGQETQVANDGPSALAALDGYEADVALLDIAMPGMDGYELCRRVRERPGRRPLLVALTGYGQEEDRRRAFEAGFDRHLVKPTSLDALKDLLADAGDANRNGSPAAG